MLYQPSIFGGWFFVAKIGRDIGMRTSELIQRIIVSYNFIRYGKGMLGL